VLHGIWNENYGHIYPTLKMLEQDKMIEVLTSEEDSRRIQYGITEKGKQEIKTWLMEETALQPVRSEFMLKFLFSNQQPRENVIGMLKEYKEIHEHMLERYLEMKRDLDKGIKEISPERALFVGATLRKGIISCQGTIQWCNETIDQLMK
jgi:DNA-binding PadR family transcriptional regulator